MFDPISTDDVDLVAEFLNFQGNMNFSELHFDSDFEERFSHLQSGANLFQTTFDSNECSNPVSGAPALSQVHPSSIYLGCLKAGQNLGLTQPSKDVTTDIPAPDRFSSSQKPIWASLEAKNSFYGGSDNKVGGLSFNDFANYEVRASALAQTLVDSVELVKDTEIYFPQDYEESAGLGKESHKCSVSGCERSFAWKWALQEHEQKHTLVSGEKCRDFDCEFCGKSFFTKSCLKSHIKIHTRKPNSYKCPNEECSKSYSTSEGLRLHIRNHHQVDKRWKCPVEGCCKDFVRQSDMRLHMMRIHSNSRPHPCRHEGCTKSFACFSELRRHEQSHLRKIKKQEAIQKRRIAAGQALALK